MAEKSKKPAIRFAGFTDAWEQRKLSDMYQSIVNAFVGTATPYYVENGHFYLESNNIKEGLINHNTEVFINDEFYEKQKDKWLHTGDIVMVQSGHVGHAAVIPEELNNTAAHALIMFRSPKEKIEPYFLNYQYQTLKSKKKIDNITVGNTIKHILASDMQEFVVDFTSYEEQSEIAACFKNLDNLITLHQCKHDKLVNVKKAMLEKMFPKDEADVPEIRFKGFTEAWEQRKLGEVLETRRGLTYSPSDVCQNGIRVLRSSNINSDSFVISEDDVFVNREAINIEFVKENDILITAANGSSKLVGKHAIIRNIQENSAVHGGFMLLGTSNEPYFINASMDTLWYRKFIDLFVAGGNGAIGNLNKTDLDNQEISIPSKEEQKIIGLYFRRIDNLITLHQRKYDKLVNVKKAMLEKMFPKDGADVPEIRFKGFTEAWEQCKLWNLASFSKGYGYSKSDLMESGTPIILYGRLYTNYETVISDVDTYTNEKKGSVYSRGGEVIVPASGETAEDISVASVVEKQGVLLGGDLNIINPARILNSVFLAISISNGNPHKEMAKMAQGKSVVHLHNADLEKINLNFPSCDEQVLISTYFQNIDNLITLHQRKFLNLV